ncbi:MAG: hypothetical protein M1822_004487 [Bathelium mastoideum]|nr:MAG: hypothetical protein M1822_004487 [Bathelium mastoideum]
MSQIQPAWLPRPDITDGLHINYRRIPILAIGRDVYCDSRAILDALEQRYGKSSFKLNDPAKHGIRKLFESHCMHGGTFWHAASLLPMWEKPFLQDPKFLDDRSKLLGRPFDREAVMQARPEGLAHMRMAYELMETTFLADGRRWILGNDEGPSLVDIDAVYPLQWIVRDQLMQGGTPEEFISAKRFPKTFAWIDRFLAAVGDAQSRAPETTKLSGEEAVSKILGAAETVFEGYVDADDPLGLRVNDTARVKATDYASTHSDSGKLLRLTVDQVCILNDKNLRLHFPRWNFSIQKVKEVSDEMTKYSDPQKMRLIYHPMSPNSRKVYMFAIELGLDQNIALDTVVVAPIPYPGWSDNNEEVSKFNPVAKIPALVPAAHGDGIYDSRTITDFLLEISATRPSESADNKQRWRLKTLHALADAMLDAFVLIVYENKIRAENGIKFDVWIAGQTEKINRSLSQFEMEAERGTLRTLGAQEIATAADVAVAAALGFSDIMKHEWRTGRPKLVEWFSGWERRDAFVRTRPEVDWKSGEASVDAFAAKVVAGK